MKKSTWMKKKESLKYAAIYVREYADTKWYQPSIQLQKGLCQMTADELGYKVPKKYIFSDANYWSKEEWSSQWFSDMNMVILRQIDPKEPPKKKISAIICLSADRLISNWIEYFLYGYAPWIMGPEIIVAVSPDQVTWVKELAE